MHEIAKPKSRCGAMHEVGADSRQTQIIGYRLLHGIADEHDGVSNALEISSHARSGVTMDESYIARSLSAVSLQEWQSYINTLVQDVRFGELLLISLIMLVPAVLATWK